MVTVRLLQGDITGQAVDAIVHAANSSLPDGLPSGGAVATTAGRLPAFTAALDTAREP
ncbi:hypothetical protein [Frankia sp. EI5c]|uniref:hypothetical protein n=1 Tax=Frankia sp. EI5c TaxID=683316 RepID=UPI001F5B166C|nr:hypothetical protein [Frankia sp. EI5c]